MAYLFALFNEHVLVSNQILAFTKALIIHCPLLVVARTLLVHGDLFFCIYLKLGGTFSLPNASWSNMLFHCLQGTFRLMMGPVFLPQQVGGMRLGTIGDMPFSFLNTTQRQLVMLGYSRNTYVSSDSIKEIRI
jgi:hypothetical protein